MTLRRVAELAGMSEHCDFTEQETLTGEAGRQRPDMIVNLPGGRRIAVDAKVPLQAFLDAAGAGDEEERRKSLARHGQLVRAHMNQLAVRSYWEQLDPDAGNGRAFPSGRIVLRRRARAGPHADRRRDGEARHPGDAHHAHRLVTRRRLWMAAGTVASATRRPSAIWAKQLYDRVRTFVGHFEGVGTSRCIAPSRTTTRRWARSNRAFCPRRDASRNWARRQARRSSKLEPVDETPRALAAPEREASE